MTPLTVLARRALIASLAACAAVGSTSVAFAQQRPARPSMRDLMPPPPNYRTRLPAPPRPVPTPPPPWKRFENFPVRPTFKPPGVKVTIPHNFP